VFPFFEKEQKKSSRTKKRKKRKEVFKFHFLVSFLIIMPVNVLLIIFVKE